MVNVGYSVELNDLCSVDTSPSTVRTAVDPEIVLICSFRILFSSSFLILHALSVDRFLLAARSSLSTHLL